MVVDSSALIAILEDEPDAADFAGALADAESAVISAASLVEVSMLIVSRHGLKALSRVHALIREAGIEVEPVSPRHAELAIEAFVRFGKGRQHKARLNFGDCLVYALAKATGMPVLFKGDDFTHTDLVKVLRRTDC